VLHKRNVPLLLAALPDLVWRLVRAVLIVFELKAFLDADVTR
jgi:hypothetical protein